MQDSVTAGGGVVTDHLQPGQGPQWGERTFPTRFNGGDRGQPNKRQMRKRRFELH